MAVCVESFASEPKPLAPDLDATDIPLHGDREERFSNGYRMRPTLVPAHARRLLQRPTGATMKAAQDAPDVAKLARAAVPPPPTTGHSRGPEGCTGIFCAFWRGHHLAKQLGRRP